MGARGADLTHLCNVLAAAGSAPAGRGAAGTGEWRFDWGDGVGMGRMAALPVLPAMTVHVGCTWSHHAACTGQRSPMGLHGSSVWATHAVWCQAWYIRQPLSPGVHARAGGVTAGTGAAKAW